MDKKSYLVMVITLLVGVLIGGFITWGVMYKLNQYPEGTTTIKKVFIPAKTVVVPAPDPELVILPADTFWMKVDSAKIMAQCPQVMPVLEECYKVQKDYYSKKVFNRTLLNDSNFLATMRDTTYMNRLLEGEFHIELKKPISTTTTVYGEIPRNKVYVGIGVMLPMKHAMIDSTQLSLSLLLALKKHWAFELGASVPIRNYRQVYIEGKAYYKLSFRKNR